jgi:hypothetical protein
MKYLKKYKLFESFDYESTIEDLKDMSLEVQDLGMNVNVWSEKITTTIVTSPVPDSYINSIQINIKRVKGENSADIMDFIQRSINYMKGWNNTIFGSNNFKMYDLNDLDLSIKLYEIYIRFYKTNDTYHVINHGTSHWNLIKCDFEDYDTANDWIIKNKLSNPGVRYSSAAGLKVKIISDEEYWKAVGKSNYFG